MANNTKSVTDMLPLNFGVKNWKGFAFAFLLLEHLYVLSFIVNSQSLGYSVITTSFANQDQDRNPTSLRRQQEIHCNATTARAEDEERDEANEPLFVAPIERKKTTNRSNKKVTGAGAGKFAYAFIVSGCSDVSCTGYVLNSIVASYVLRTYNSTADVVMVVRMQASNQEGRLPSYVEEWLFKANVKVGYLPPVPVDNFGTAVLEKFRVLEMTEYDR